MRCMQHLRGPVDKKSLGPPRRQCVARRRERPALPRQLHKEFLWHAFCHLQGWASDFDGLPALAPVKPDPAEQTISDVARDLTSGQGHSLDPKKIEKIGMDFVTAYFEYQEPAWQVVHVDLEKCGWDITATLGEELWCVEVKATSGSPGFLTANEPDKAETNTDWIMAVVTLALSESLLTWYTAADVVAAVRPVPYRARLVAAEGSRSPDATPPI